MDGNLPNLTTTLPTSTPSLSDSLLAQEFLSSFGFSTTADIHYTVKDRGIAFDVNGKEFVLEYPQYIWDSYPQPQQKILSQNLAFCFTFFLPYLVPTLKKMKYHMPVPLADPFLFKGFSYSIPSIAFLDDIAQKTTTNLLRQLFQINYVFENKKTEFPEVRHVSDQSEVIIPFSFGKDSLLTLGLSQELGLKVHPVYISEPGFSYEYEMKKLLAADFYQEFKIPIEFLENTFGVFRDSNGFVGWELQLTHYSLMLLPYVFAHNAAYIFFANEQSCNDTIIDKEGFRCNPVYEQSNTWLQQNSVMASLIGGNSLAIGSIIEPLHEIAIIKILHHRYPELAKYQMSCDPEDKEQASLGSRRWCENCSKCARIFMFLLAHGVDPKRVGFSHNLLDEQYIRLFTIFGLAEEKAYGYDASENGKDEQLLAFYLAHKNGARGKIMELAEQKYFPLVQKREAILRNRYFGIHTTLTVPPSFRSKLLTIYHEELDPLKW